MVCPYKKDLKDLELLVDVDEVGQRRRQCWRRHVAGGVAGLASEVMQTERPGLITCETMDAVPICDAFVPVRGLQYL